MFLRLNWETTGLTSSYALLASGTNLFKLDEAFKFTTEDLGHWSFTGTSHRDDTAFIGEMDHEAMLTLAKLSADIECFTLRELKQMHRRSRVAIEAEMTNNLHIHKRILKLLEDHVVFDSEQQRMQRLNVARKEAMASYKKALERCTRTHDKLRDAENKRLKAEEEYLDAMMELNRAEQEKKRVISVIENQHVGEGARRRTTSM